MTISSPPIVHPSANFSPPPGRLQKTTIAQNPIPQIARTPPSGPKSVPYENIKNKIGIDDLDANKLETYLSDDEFLKVMGCPREEFAKIPLWKQNNKKRAVGLL